MSRTTRIDHCRGRPSDRLRLEFWSVDRLIPSPRNARTHSDAQIAEIAGSKMVEPTTIPDPIGAPVLVSDTLTSADLANATAGSPVRAAPATQSMDVVAVRVVQTVTKGPWNTQLASSTVSRPRILRPLVPGLHALLADPESDQESCSRVLIVQRLESPISALRLEVPMDSGSAPELMVEF